MKYHLDEDESQITARVGRDRYRFDLTSSHELSMEGVTDGELLRWCDSQGRCLVTKNGKDFVRLTYQFQAEGLSHAGVLIIPRSIRNDEFERIARALAWFDELHPDGVPPYFVDFLRDPPNGWHPSADT